MENKFNKETAGISRRKFLAGGALAATGLGLSAMPFKDIVTRVIEYETGITVPGREVKVLAADQAPWTLSTWDTKLVLAKSGGSVIVRALQTTSPATEHNWASPGPEADLPKVANMAGKPQPIKWKLEGAAKAPDGVSFIYVSSDPALRATSTWTARKWFGPIEHSVSIENRTGETVVFPPPSTIAMSLIPSSGSSLENWWVRKGAGKPEETGTHVDRVATGYSQSLTSRPYSGPESDSNDPGDRDAIPWFSLQDTSGKQGIYGGIEFSGRTRILIESPAAGKVSLAMGFDPTDAKARVSVAAGKTLSYPVCFVGAYTGDVDDGANRLHRWVERYIRPEIPGGITPVLVNNSWGSGMVVDETHARKMIDDCAEMGIELYHVDAGWYKNVGDWHTNPGKFPSGLEKVADYAHSKGLKFGLWVGWTQGGSDRDAGPDVLSVFNPDQKSWFGDDLPKDWKNEDWWGATACLASKDAQDWCLNALRRMVKQYKLDLLEHDQNMILDACSRGSHGHIASDFVDTSRASAEGYYHVYDQLRKENPDLLFEDCVNGGRLVDFGVAKRCHYICATDSYDPLSCRQGFYDASYPLPPSMVEQYIANYTGESIESFRSMLRSAMVGWCTVMIDTSQWSPEQKKAAIREFAFYKNNLRPLIASGDLYHVLPRPDGKRWDGIQYFDPKTGRGALMVFRPQSSPVTQSVKLRGLSPKGMYLLQSADGSVDENTLSGKDLMEMGVSLKLEKTDSSDIVFITRK